MEGVSFNAPWLIAAWAEFKARAQEAGGAISRLLTGTSGNNVPANTIPGTNLSSKTLAAWDDAGIVADGMNDLAAGAATVLGNVPGVETLVDIGGGLVNLAKGDLKGAAPYALGKAGNAPTFKTDGTSVEIHHVGQNPNGPFKEMHKADHRMGGNNSKNHPQGQAPLTKQERKEFDVARRDYRKNEYKSK